MNRCSSSARVWLCFSLAMALLGCSAKEPPKAVAAEAPTKEQADWVNEEILVQLKELRREVAEIKAVREDVKALQQAVSQLDSKVAGARGAAAAVAQREVTPKEVLVGGAPTLGRDTAKVAIAEFSDFQCPYCARHHKEVFPQIKSAFIDTGKVKYIARTYPLPFHDQAKGASIAALCADRSGRYWKMHDALFEHSRALGRTVYLAQAKALDLDESKFSSCLDSGEMASKIESEVAYGNTLGVSGTPKFFVGRIAGNKIVDVTVISGAQPFASFASAIESKLK